MSADQDLRAAIYSDADLGEIVWCLQQGADANQPLHHGSTPLLEATTVEVAATLVEFGARIDAEDDYGRGVLHALAYSNEARALANFYQERGANPEVGDVDGRTALLHCLACPQGSKDAPLALLAIGANVRAVDAQGNNALHCWAMGRACARVGVWLINEDVDPAAKNKLGQTATDLLIDEGHGDKIEAIGLLGAAFDRGELELSTPQVAAASQARRV